MFCSKCGVENAEEAKFCKDCGNPLGAQPPSPPQTEVVLPASITQRFLHLIVDGIASYIFAAIVTALAISLYGDGIGVIIGLFAFYCYHLIFEATFQQTIGKMLTGTKVVSVTGEKPTFLAIFGRSLARYIPFEAFSFLFYGSYPTKGWHDRLSHTLVVPKKLTPEEIRRIDLQGASEGNGGSIILIIVAVGLFLIVTVGILASVVLASLNSAREKGQDAAIKATLSNIRSQAELYYFENADSYDGFCADRDTQSLLQSTSGSSVVNYVCNDDELGFAVSAPLSGGGHFCVDSMGNRETTSGPATEPVCIDTRVDLRYDASSTVPVTDLTE